MRQARGAILRVGKHEIRCEDTHYAPYFAFMVFGDDELGVETAPRRQRTCAEDAGRTESPVFVGFRSTVGTARARLAGGGYTASFFERYFPVCPEWTEESYCLELEHLLFTELNEDFDGSSREWAARVAGHAFSPEISSNSTSLEQYADLLRALLDVTKRRRLVGHLQQIGVSRRGIKDLVVPRATDIAPAYRGAEGSDFRDMMAWLVCCLPPGVMAGRERYLDMIDEGWEARELLRCWMLLSVAEKGVPVTLDISDPVQYWWRGRVGDVQSLREGATKCLSSARQFAVAKLLATAWFDQRVLGLVEYLHRGTVEAGRPSRPRTRSSRTDVDHDFRHIVWGQRTYTFTDQQAVIVRVLCEAHLRSDAGVHKDVIAQACGRPPLDFRIQNYFIRRKASKRIVHKAWGELIERIWSKPGYYRIRREFPRSAIQEALRGAP